jgi:hypothetical protein
VSIRVNKLTLVEHRHLVAVDDLPGPRKDAVGLVGTTL